MNFLRRSRALLSACAVALALAASAAPARAADEKKYLRFAEDGDNHQLQTSVVRFQNDAGVKVDLIGAVHIADATYFDDLNGRFKAYDALLYEMVKPKGMNGIGRPATRPATRAAAKPRGGGGGGWILMIQRFMQDQLDLEFQLDRIDYTPENFVHADLDAETFTRRQEERGESMLTLMLNQMLRELNKPAGAAGDRAADMAGQMGLMDLIEALQSPDRARQLKLVLGRQFEGMDEALDAMGGPDGSVILTERNEHAMRVLKDEVAAGKKNIGVFYGAAHLRGMEEIMTKEMGFKQVDGPEWLVAWDLAERSARPAPKAIEPAPHADAPTTQRSSTRPTTRTSDARWGRDD